MMQISEKMNNKLPIRFASGKRMSKMLFLTYFDPEPEISAKEGQQATPYGLHLGLGMSGRKKASGRKI